MKTLMLTAGISSLVFTTAVLGFGMSTQVMAQDDTGTPPPPPPGCETGAGFADFDFWVGEWNVYSNDAARQFQGTNSITKHYNDCLVKETWQGAGGSGGFSINYFNPLKDEWRQVWVAGGYSIDYTGGLDDTGAMVHCYFFYAINFGIHSDIFFAVSKNPTLYANQ